MNVPAIAAAIFLLLIIVPAPLVWLDSVFHRWLAQRIVNASGGKVDYEAASDRIRFHEGIDPRQSAVLFAGLGLLLAAAIRISNANLAAVQSGLVLVLAFAAAALGAFQDRYTWARPVAFLAGAIAVVAML
jgi:hypothetical protein